MNRYPTRDNVYNLQRERQRRQAQAERQAREWQQAQMGYAQTPHPAKRKKHRQRRRGSHMMMPLLVFAIIALYLVGQIGSLAIKGPDIDVETVAYGTIDTPEVYTGLILREEYVVDSTRDGQPYYQYSQGDYVPKGAVVCTVKDKRYAQYFGFTEEETKTMLEYYGLELNEEVKAMYNGYRFGDEEIYNPWSVLNYASRRALEPYWVNTSSNKMIRKAMEGRDLTFARGYEKLIETGRLETLVRMETSFFEVSSTDSLWGLFVNAGYLTIEQVISHLDGLYVLRIPDQEVQREFQELTACYLNVEDTQLGKLFIALKWNRKEEFIDNYCDMLLTLPSYHDLKDENSYHVLFLGMCAWLSNEYDIISNREEGKGRCDIILKAKKEGLASYVLEFKYLKEADAERLEESAKEAVMQIKEKRYDAELQGRAILIGLAHAGKEVSIEWQERS